MKTPLPLSSTYWRLLIPHPIRVPKLLLLLLCISFTIGRLKAQCDTGTNAPSLILNILENTCPLTTANLALVTSINLPSTNTVNLEWHNSATTTNNTTLVANPSNVNAGSYYAVFHDFVQDCYSPTSELLVTINACNPSPEICGNNIDDDGDLLIDENDPDCNNSCNSCANANCNAAPFTNQINANANIDGVGPNLGCDSGEVRTVTSGSTETFCSTITTPTVLSTNFMSFFGGIPATNGGCNASQISNWTLSSNCTPISPASFTTIPPNLPNGAARPTWQIQGNTTYEMCYDVTIAGTCSQITTPCIAPHWVYPPCELFLFTALQDCSANNGTFDVFVQFSNGGQGAGSYTLINNGLGTLAGDDPNTTTDGFIRINNIPDGSAYSLTIQGDQLNSGCNFEISSPNYTCSFCPKILTASVASDECVGNTVTLTATVDTGIEGDDYYIEWLRNGNPINQTGSATFGLDGIWGNADDPLSALSYTHTLAFDFPTTSCSFEDQVFTARLYCKSSQTLEQGNIDVASTTESAIYNYNALNKTCIGLDLTTLPLGVIAEGFNYQYRVTSGDPFGLSWICEAVLSVETPAGVSCPLCSAYWNGNCPTQPAGSGTPGPNAITCPGGPGNGFGSILNPTNGPGLENLGGAFSTTPANGNWDVCIFDSYNDTGGNTEGVMNYLFIKVNYFLPPGIDVNFPAYSIVDAVNISSPNPSTTTPVTTTTHPQGAGLITGLRVCNSPVEGIDYSLPDFNLCEEFITPICPEAIVKYSADNGLNYLLDTPPAPYGAGDVIYYRITTINCANSCGVEGSYTLGNCNLPPIAINDINTTQVNNPVGGNVLTNDSDPNNNTIILDTNPSNVVGGTVVLNPDGSYVFSPAVEFVGEASFDYLICDDASPVLCDMATVVIEVLDNPSPTVNTVVGINDNFISENDTDITSNLLINDSDPQGDNLTVNTTPVSSISNGTLILHPNGDFTYMPTAGFVGEATFEYEVCDDGTPVACDTVLVTIDVLETDNQNDIYATDDAAVGYEGEIFIASIISNDFDPENDNISLTTIPIVGVNNGTLTLTGNGVFSYNPLPGFTGNDQFIYEICDDGNPIACDTATVYLTILENQYPPLVIPNSITTLQDNTASICVPIIDPNEGDSFNATLCANSPEQGIAFLTVIGNELCITYIPEAGYSGTDSICLLVCDQTGLCDETTIPVIVVPPLTPATDTEPPMLIPTPITVPQDSSTEVCTTILDPNMGDVFTAILCTNSPMNGTAIPTIIANELCIEYTPNTGFTGEDPICIIVCDQTGLCDTTNIPVTVIPTPLPPDVIQAPIGVIPPIVTPEDSTQVVCGTIIDANPRDTHVASICEQPMNGTVIVEVDNLSSTLCLTFIPSPDFFGTDEVCVLICDQTGLCDTLIVPILVISQEEVCNDSTDTDNDGLTDCEETTGIDDPSTPIIPAGTSDPNNDCDPIATSDLTDTDGDGLTDCEETTGTDNPNTPTIPTTTSDPNNPCDPIATSALTDTDGDGLSNCEETTGTDNPNTPAVPTGLSDPTDSCDPFGAVVATADCDGDGNPNGTDPNPLDPVANDDAFTATPDETTTYDILNNDDFLADPVNTSITDLGSGTATGTIVLDPTDGTIDYTPSPDEVGTTVTVDYQVCYTANTPLVCAVATVSIVVPACPASLDTDNDGLTDCEETTGIDDPSTPIIPAGTSDPNNDCDPIATSDLTDTDGDGLTDCEETTGTDNPNTPTIPTTTSDPNNPCDPIATSALTDTDGDGLSNCEETTGTDNPNTPAVPTGLSDPTDSCDPFGAVVATADCDGDGNPNATDPNPLDPVANDDAFTATPDETTTYDILNNDDFLADPVTTSITDLGSGTAAGTIVLDPTDGTIDYTPSPDEVGTTVTVDYQVCYTANTPLVCAVATISIVVPACPASLDTDNDGLTDCEETTGIDDPSTPIIPAGTSDPNNDCDPIATSDLTDTDGDGLTDCEETTGTDNPNTPTIPTTTSDPNNPCDPIASSALTDTDGDGLSNCEETTGTDNPNTPAVPTGLSDPTDSCDPFGAIVATADCDGDGNPNATDPNPLDPVANDDAFTATPDETTTYDILNNDDFLADPVNTSITDLGSGTATGTIVLDPTDGTIDYTPNPDEVGTTVTVDYQVCYTANTPLVCAVATISIVVPACPASLDTDNDGLTDCEEITGVDDPSTPIIPTGTSDPNNECDPNAVGNPTGDCDGDGIDNGTEIANGSDPFDICDPLSPQISVGNDGTECVDPEEDLNLFVMVDNGATPYTYRWTGPNNFESISPNPILPNANNALSGTYIVTVTNALGCTSVAETVLDVALRPIEPELSSNGPVCVGEMLILSAPVYEGIDVYYEWIGPSGSTTDGSYPSGHQLVVTHVEVEMAGAYQVSVIVDACSSEISVPYEIELNELPVINPTNNSIPCADYQYDLNLTANPSRGLAPYNFLWEGPNGFSSTTENPVLINADETDSGTYSLLVTDANGCQSSVVSTIVEITTVPLRPSLTIAEQNTATVYCEGSNILLTTQAYIGTTVLYTWTMADGSIVETTDPQLYIEQADLLIHDGMISVRVEVDGCSSEISVPVLLAITAAPSVNVNNTTSEEFPACIGETVQLQAPYVSGISYNWFGPNGFTSTAPSPSIEAVTYADTGLYYLILEQGNCSSEVIGSYVYVLPEMEEPIALKEGNDCEGNDMLLKVANPEPEVLYDWHRSSNNLFVGSGVELIIPQITQQDAGGYYVIGTHAVGCRSTASNSIQLSVDDAALAIAQEDLLICGNEIEISAEAVTTGQGQWSTPEENITNIHTPNSATTYLTDLVIGQNIFIWNVQSETCGTNYVDSTIVTVSSEVEAEDDFYLLDMNESIDSTVILNDLYIDGQHTVALTTMPENGTIVLQANGDFLYVPFENYIGHDQLTYEICMDACPDQCVEAKIAFQIGTEAPCTIPSIITPNDDGMNDELIINCLTLYPNSSISIFNRWGDEVFHHENYQNDWNGRYQGNALPVGTYFYILELNDDLKSHFTGYIFIQR